MRSCIGREGGNASGGELKGKRKVVEPRADLFDDRRGFEPRISRARPGGKELRRILRLEGRDGIGLLAGQPQQLPARHEKPKLRAGGEQPREVAGRIDQMLEVVEDEQESTVGDSFGEAVPCSRVPAQPPRPRASGHAARAVEPRRRRRDSDRRLLRPLGARAWSCPLRPGRSTSTNERPRCRAEPSPHQAHAGVRGRAWPESGGSSAAGSLSGGNASSPSW